MIDRIFSAALTFCLLTAGTLAIGSALFGLDRAKPARYVQLPPVTVIGQRVVSAVQPAASLGAAPRPTADCREAAADTPKLVAATRSVC